MPARVRLTYDGKVKGKVPGRRREVFEVPFLDKYRERAFRNLRFTLQHLNMEIIGEESIKRVIEVSYEDEGVIHNHKLQVEDKTLHVLFTPPKGAHRLCPSLKGKYKIIFSYEGKGIFNASPVGELSEKEKEDIERFVRYILRPHYSLAFINDSAVQNIQNKVSLYLFSAFIFLFFLSITKRVGSLFSPPFLERNSSKFSVFLQSC